MVVEEILIEKIHTDNQLVRKSMDDDHIIELASSIASQGLLQPIVVASRSDGDYNLKAGAHRLAAVKRLHWAEVPANVQEESSAAKSRATAIIENVLRKQMTLEEEVMAVQILFNEEKKSPSEICQVIGKSRAWVDRRLSIPNLRERIVEVLMDGQISIVVAETINGVEDDGIRASILNEAIYAKRTHREVSEMVHLAENVPTMGEAIQAGGKTLAELAAPAKPGRPCDSCDQRFPVQYLQVLWVCKECLGTSTSQSGKGAK
ncbi:MAG: ParB/RepB/Spo0J family partition protein [Proteobacteria bacterium]|nr:ParB/RepB/Spo0J family partition protein [Pseudomonadota bacterium]